MTLCKEKSMVLVQEKIIEFISYEVQRAQKGEISLSNIPNYSKAMKLFCEMNDIHEMILVGEKSLEVFLEDGGRLMIGLNKERDPKIIRISQPENQTYRIHNDFFRN